MSHVDLIYKFNGREETIKNGLDVFELAPMLLSVGELVKQGNKILFPNSRDITVNVKPFTQGSFIVDILIFASSRFQALLDYVNSDTVKQIKELLEWVGILGSTGISVFGLIKFLKGKPKSVEQSEGDQFKYYDQDDNLIIVPKEIHMLFQSGVIQKVFYNSFGRPLEITGISHIETYLSSDPSVKAKFSKPEAEFLKNYAQSEIPVVSPDEIIESRLTTYLVPKRGSFSGDGNKWSFYLGEATITANIKDEAFLKKCDEGEIKPHFKDVLHVELFQKIKKLNGQLDPGSISFEVTKVLEYQAGMANKQTSFENS